MTSTPLTPTPAFSIEALPRRWVARVFERLAGQLGSKLTDLYAGVKSEVVQAEWGLGLAGFTGEEIDRGLTACLTRKFAPTLGEFLQLCRPSLDADIAWAEASEGLLARRQGKAGEWSHPAVYRAATAMYEAVRQGSLRACRTRWEHVLRSEFAKGWGEGVPGLPARALTHQHVAAPMPDAVRRLLASRGLVLGALK